MAEITLLEAAKHSQDKMERAVTRIIVESSPILEYIPMMGIDGPAYRYSQERSLGKIGYRRVGEKYVASSGIINPQFEPLIIIGGEVVIDRFEVKVMSNVLNLKSEKFRMKSRAAGIFYSEQFFEGDTSSDDASLDGIRRRIPTTSKQYLNAKTGGAALTLSMLDVLIDKVVGEDSMKVLWMSEAVRRQVTSLVRAQSGSGRIEYTQDAFGKQQMMYANVPIRVVKREDDNSTILGFDEDDGSTNLDTASIYCTRFGNDFLHGIQNGSLPSVDDFGELESAPQHMGRIEWYTGLVVKHPRSIARLGHLNA